METKDIISKIKNSYTAVREGASFCVKIKAQNFSAVELCKTVEEHGMKVLGWYLNELDQGYLEVNFKVSDVYVEPLSADLQRLGYSILSCSQPSKQKEELESNFRQLMDYLKL